MAIQYFDCRKFLIQRLSAYNNYNGGKTEIGALPVRSTPSHQAVHTPHTQFNECAVAICPPPQAKGLQAYVRGPHTNMQSQPRIHPSLTSMSRWSRWWATRCWEGTREPPATHPHYTRLVTARFPRVAFVARDVTVPPLSFVVNGDSGKSRPEV